MDILSGFSPVIEQVSVDEAFLDMTGSGRLFGTPAETASRISSAINEQLLLTASIGIAPNKFLSKIASDINKPNGITVTPFDQQEIEVWLSPLTVGKLWGVGNKTLDTFHRMGITTVCDLQKLTLDFLAERFGKHGESLYYLCRGIDERPVAKPESAKSISREFTFQSDSSDKEEWKRTLLALSQDVGRKARRKGVKGSTIVLCYRRPDFSRHSKRLRAQYPTNLSKEIYEQGLKILAELQERSLRLIGIGITDFEEDMQTNLFSDHPKTQALEASEKAVDEVIARFGKGCIRRGSTLP
jgi:DNA polymerase-4